MTSETPQTRTLKRALEIAGSAERLSERLQCTPAQLKQWLAGKVATPADVYLRALDVVSAGSPRR